MSYFDPNDQLYLPLFPLGLAAEPRSIILPTGVLVGLAAQPPRQFPIVIEYLTRDGTQTSALHL
ncbi:hypothetical protein PM082_024188 [Marasmius tenuissimus]|nr:hypothetical protein PM082_024188 [Marasmius tenuissimus]